MQSCMCNSNSSEAIVVSLRTLASTNVSLLDSPRRPRKANWRFGLIEECSVLLCALWLLETMNTEELLPLACLVGDSQVRSMHTAGHTSYSDDIAHL